MTRTIVLSTLLCIYSLSVHALETSCPARGDEPGFIRRVQEKIVKWLESDFDWRTVFAEQVAPPPAEEVKTVSRANAEVPAKTPQ